jgi:hypothetical protein
MKGSRRHGHARPRGKPKNRGAKKRRAKRRRRKRLRLKQEELRARGLELDREMDRMIALPYT